MLKKKSLLLILLAVCLLIILFELVLILFNNKSGKNLQKTISRNEIIKPISTPINETVLFPGKFNILSEDLSQGLLKQVEFNAVIDSNISTEGSYSFFYVSYPLNNGQKLKIKVNLINNKNILSYFVNTKTIPKEQNWEALSISDLSPEIQKDKLIYLRYYLSEQPDVLKKDERCKEHCLQLIAEIKKYYQSNLETFKRLNENSHGENLQIGAVTAILIQNNEQ